MEKISYYEAREWFWIRTCVWLLPIILISVMAIFALSDDYIKPFSTKLWVAIGIGIAASLIGLMAASLSMSFPWMRLGWRLSLALNGPACAAVAALTAFLLGGLVTSFLQDTAVNPATRPKEYAAYLAMIDTAYKMMLLGIVASGFWGFILGSWFAMRRDKYFIEQI